jgi:hypothetical protein
MTPRSSEKVPTLGGTYRLYVTVRKATHFKRMLQKFQEATMKVFNPTIHLEPFSTNAKKGDDILLKEVSDLQVLIVLSGFLLWVSGLVLGIRDVGEDRDLEEEAISVHMSNEVNHVQQLHRPAQPWLKNPLRISR